MQENDRPDCLRIFRACLRQQVWRGDASEYVRALKYAMVNGDAYVSVEPQAGPVGFLTLIDRTTYVDHLFVDPDWRLCGIARGLLETARQDIGESLTLDVDQKNGNARAAYATLGWKEVALKPNSRIPGGQVRLIGP
mgnify:CR=1 FL=1